MRNSPKLSPEVIERAVRMVFGARAIGVTIRESVMLGADRVID